MTMSFIFFLLILVSSQIMSFDGAIQPSKGLVEGPVGGYSRQPLLALHFLPYFLRVIVILILPMEQCYPKAGIHEDFLRH